MGHGFLFSALVFLATAVLCVPLSQRLGLGSVLGYLVGGLAIGPWGAGLITNVEDILHFSELGVVLFLFLIGLELEPKRLWQMRVPIFGMGSAQVLGIMGTVTAVGLLLGFSWQTSLVAGMGFALSSTAIALQILKEKNWLPTRAGSSAFSILLFQDIAVIPMIALLPLMAAQGATTPLTQRLMTTATTLGVLSAVVVGGRLILRPLLRMIAGAHLREVFTAFALLLVLAIAALMLQLDLSMGLGAFMAGVLLADSEYRHALETDIEPFKGLLLGLFFISVGMSIDVGQVLDRPGLIAGLVAALMVIKFAVHWGIARAFGLPASQRPFFSLVLAQVGEFAFVLFASAQALGAIDSSTSGILLPVVALSMLLTPVLTSAFDRWVAPHLEGRIELPADQIDNDNPDVLIAGFGRFGQIVGRLLYANGVKATVLDHEPTQIELLRRFGFKVYYGDATRIDLLEAAGASSAKILVVAIDDVADALALVDLAQAHFPHLKIYSRARNVVHVYDLIDRGISGWERETFEASLRLGTDVLRGLGWPAHPAHVAANKFRAHNIQMLHDLHKTRTDQTVTVAKAKQARSDLEKMFERDATLHEQARAGWDS